MHSILKTVSTPVRFLAKRLARGVVHGWLLRFPDGNPQSPVACVYCPELCRFSCPTAVVSGNDAVTPSKKMSLLALDMKPAVGDAPLWPIYDCTGCGRCTEYCVYEMPVAERLIAARPAHGWEPARAVANALTDAQDPWGDLGEEMGDRAAAQRRAAAATQTGWIEPKAWEWLGRAGVRRQSEAPWENWDARITQAPGLARLRDKRWLFHESVWHSRRLDQAAQAGQWIEKLRAQGIEIRRPFAQGRDCIDCGGEGAYSRLFNEQGRAMAQEIWERDRHRVDGILCMSDRCAQHLREALGPDVPVESMVNLWS